MGIPRTENPDPAADGMHAKALSESNEVIRSAKVLGSFLLVCGVVWIAAFWADRELFYIRPGSEIMYDTKAEFVQNGALLDMSKKVRVLAIGNSKIMSGFIPAQFERDVPGSSAYNWGMPNTAGSTGELEKILRRGQIPTHVLYAVDWMDVEVPSRSIFRPIASDKLIMDELFPFRRLVRNGLVFITRSRAFGGLGSFYRQGEDAAAEMTRDQGYFFIVDQSRFPDHRLPADFHLATDNPDSVIYRQPNISSRSFQQLNELAVRYGFKVLVVPYYLRKGEGGDPGVNKELVSALQPYDNFRVLGDEYYLFDNRYFSDLRHLNLDGAQMYTGLLAGMVKKELAREQIGRAHV